MFPGVGFRLKSLAQVCVFLPCSSRSKSVCFCPVALCVFALSFGPSLCVFVLWQSVQVCVFVPCDCRSKSVCFCPVAVGPLVCEDFSEDCGQLQPSCSFDPLVVRLCRKTCNAPPCPCELCLTGRTRGKREREGRERGREEREGGEREREGRERAVSYTHLTLPTRSTV